MLKLDNFLAWISVDDHPLEEYNVQYSEDLLLATCWIASEEGKLFVINWKDSVRPENSIGRTFVDGVKCGISKGINRKGYKNGGEVERDTAQQRGAATTLGTDRLLMFSKVDLTDDDRFLDWAPSEKLGEIRLEITYVRKGDLTTMAIKPFNAEGKVHERVKQVAQHHTRLGKSVRSDRKPIHRVKSMGDTRTFVFKYRPKEVLKALGIIPMATNTQSEMIDLRMHSSDLDFNMGEITEQQETIQETAIEDPSLSEERQGEMEIIPNESTADFKFKLEEDRKDRKDIKPKVEELSRFKLEDGVEPKYQPTTQREAGTNSSIKSEPIYMKQESGIIAKLETEPQVRMEVSITKLVERGRSKKIKQSQRVGTDRMKVRKQMDKLNTVETIDLTQD